MEKTYAGFTINVNDEGYLTDMNQWEVAKEMAKEDGLELGNRHFRRVRIFKRPTEKDVALTIRGVLGKSGVVDIKEFYELFPKGPLKNL